MTKKIGLHIRYPGSLTALAEKALAMHIPFFQCFLVSKQTGFLVQPTPDDVATFLRLRREHFKELYVHGSYWINLAGIAYTGHHALYRELTMAQQLEFTHMVLHPGSAKGAATKAEGIEALARALNTVGRKKFTIKIILENTAHGNLAIGGDVRDFHELLQKLDRPDAIQFCVDTAHAYSYGYDIADPAGMDAFIDEVASSVGLERVALVHLNDTIEPLGSKVDKHHMLGEGNIGFDALKNFMGDARLSNIPVLLELPVVGEDEEKKMLDIVRGW